MIRDEKDKLAFKEECDKLFQIYCERGWVEYPERAPIMFKPGDVARAGSQDDTPEAKKTGHKSAKSIASRIKRDNDYYIKNNSSKKASISGITDLTRSTMIIESFSQVPKILMELRQKLPSLQVTVCDHSSSGGYSAIHLKGTNEQGIPYEVQIHTPESFYLKQISEYEYAHWREFNYAEEHDKIVKIEDPQQRQEAQRALDEKLAMKLQDERQCEEVYKKMHAMADARISDSSIKDEISKAAQIINNEYQTNLQSGKVVTTNDNKYITALDKVLSEKSPSQEELTEILSKSKLLKKALPESQGKLIENCELALQSIYTPKVAKISAEELKTAQESLPEKPKLEVYDSHHKNQANEKQSEQEIGLNL